MTGSVRGKVFCVKVKETHREGTHSRENWGLPYTGEGKPLCFTDSDKVEHSDVMNGKNKIEEALGSAMRGRILFEK